MTQQKLDPPGRLTDLLRPEVLTSFDRETFEREGYWVWENVLTDEGRHRWTASLEKLQQMNDEIVMDTDWEAIDPQMMDLFSKVLGERFFYDHMLMLNRPAGSEGRRWHGHPYRQGQHEVEDPVGTGEFVTKEFLHQQCVRTLCYPEGATIEDGCEFAVIPGAHLYRIPFKWSTQRPDYDDDMETNWLKGKTHAFTGEPLKIRRLSIPPGSMVSFVHHLPHHVGHRKAGTDMRWGLLMAYRTPDPTAEPAKWNESAPIYWCERTEAAGNLSPTAQRLFEGDNPI
ncbi:MAG: hypothetical protein HN521_16110 [Candidatus Latescibacteria bacterium]|jgi:hypothetical protein|nr:hypothetical protein [Candidatus Latescibacterota bacterium]MBT5830068.1 hypothetical protein [Candidatus Latescibacterota bacterium]